MRLSSSSANSNTVNEFKDIKWQKLETDFITSRLTFFTAIEADRRNYCWVANIDALHVNNGNSWEERPAGLFLNNKITTIEVDSDNKIWIGTDKNGVFIMNQ